MTSRTFRLLAMLLAMLPILGSWPLAAAEIDANQPKPSWELIAGCQPAIRIDPLKLSPADNPAVARHLDGQTLNLQAMFADFALGATAARCGFEVVIEDGSQYAAAFIAHNRLPVTMSLVDFRRHTTQHPWLYYVGMMPIDMNLWLRATDARLERTATQAADVPTTPRAAPRREVWSEPKKIWVTGTPLVTRDEIPSALQELLQPASNQ